MVWLQGILESFNIVIPFFGMMLLTFFVWIWMYVKRIKWILQNGIVVENLKTSDALNQIIPEEINRPANNLKNLFELPVLFYAVCIYLMFFQSIDKIYIYCAYGFFVMRIIHSFIHCTVNIVIWRFIAYILASVCLWIMIINSTLSIFSI